MFGYVYLIVPSVAGFCLLSRWLPGTPALVRLVGGFLAGMIVSSWVTYALAAGLSGQTDSSLKIGMWVTVVASVAATVWAGRLLLWRSLIVTPMELVVTAASFGFSWWLMGERLAPDPSGTKHELMVSANTWADWALHLSLARGFSVGSNYPTEYPFYANVPIRYHYGYDFYTGALQNGGMPILQAYKLPVGLAFTAMMVLLYALARMLFAPKRPDLSKWRPHRGDWIGILATLLLITDQSVTWFRFFKVDAGGSVSKLFDPDVLSAHKGYLAIGYYNGTDAIPNYVTLNEYLTESHQVFAVAICLFLSFILLEQLRGRPRLDLRRALLIGVLLGLSLWINALAWAAAMVFFGALLLIFGGFAVGRRIQAQRLSQEEPLTEPSPEPEAPIEIGPSTSQASVPADEHVVVLPSISPQDDHMTSGQEFEPVPTVELVSTAEPATTDELAPVSVAVLDGGTSREESPTPTVREEAGAWLKAAALLLGPSLALGVAQLLWLARGGVPQKYDTIHIGYLVCNWTAAPCHKDGQMDLFSLTDWSSFLHYWWLNRGIALPLLVVAFLAGRHFDKKVIAAISAIFIITSTFQFSSDIGGTSHKLINVWATLTDLFVALAVVQVCELGAALFRRARLTSDAAPEQDIDPLTRGTLAGAGMLAWLSIPVMVFVLIASGIVDFAVIKNDFKVPVFGDDTEEAAIAWIATDTPKHAVFLTNYGDLYTPPTLGGRGIFLGYVPWVQNAGYDPEPRLAATKEIYAAQNHDEACRLLKQNKIDYVQIGPSERALDKTPDQRNFLVNEDMFKSSFTLAHSEARGGASYDYYAVDVSCRNVQ